MTQSNPYIEQDWTVNTVWSIKFYHHYILQSQDMHLLSPRYIFECLIHAIPSISASRNFELPQASHADATAMKTYTLLDPSVERLILAREMVELSVIDTELAHHTDNK